MVNENKKYVHLFRKSSAKCKCGAKIFSVDTIVGGEYRIYANGYFNTAWWLHVVSRRRLVHPGWDILKTVSDSTELV